jgi:hypothetical protein
MNKKSLRVSAVVIAAATFVAGIATMSTAATQTNGSDDPLYFVGYTVPTVTSGTIVPATTSMAWAADIESSGSSSSVANVTCPSTTTGGFAFVSARGSERVKTSWQGYKVANPSGATGSKVFTQIQMSPNTFNLGAASTVKDSGGAWSLGLACTSASGATIDKVIYRHIDVTATSGAFTAVATSDAPVATASATPTPAPTSGTVALSAATINSVQGTVSLAIASPASTTFGTATLVDNKSTSVGSLPVLTVLDERFNTKPGWDLKTSVAPFVNASNNAITFDQKNLGIAPTVSGASEAGGVTLGDVRVAGALNNYPYQFAGAAAGNTVGTTVLGGTLTLVAPIGTPAGTYNSTLTFTLTTR